jgi:ABC-type nitrate/sulfonate/bicarbonate transport system substrate-binding protein
MNWFISKSIKFELIATVLLFIALIAGCRNDEQNTVKYGITPYQDSALPIVADSIGLYKDSNIDFKVVPLAWGDVVSALISGAIDVAIYNFNSFQAPYENASRGSNKPVFYCPTYVFKGQAIMVHGDAGYTVFKDLPNENAEDRLNRLSNVINQLKGKRIGITEGTELEQIVLEALKIAKLDPAKDVKLIHASPEDALASFLSKDLDAFAAGLTERTEARRHGAIELLVTSDVTLPVIDGIVTTENYLKEHQQTLDSLVSIWFKTIRFMESDLSNNSKYIRNYLAKSASTRYSVEEYNIAWSFNIFPRNPIEAYELFLNNQSPYYWEKSWNTNNDFLIDSKKITSPIPKSAFKGVDVLQRLMTK